MKLTDLEADLFPLIYSFIYELPLRSSGSNAKLDDATVGDGDDRGDENGITLAFPHTCSKILRAMDRHNPFQFDKFIQFYCLGIENKRFEKLQEKINSEIELSEMLSIVFYLNFPELTFLEHLKFERDLVPLERKFRKVFRVTRNSYEDFFFKIDRIIEMVTAFIKVIKKDLNVQELSESTEKEISVGTFNIPLSSLIAVFSDVDKVINQCMRIFHWKAYYETYFEDPYLEIPSELPLVSKKYFTCEEIIAILQYEEFSESIEELHQLFSNLDCYYCDKLAATICLYFFREKDQEDLSHEIDHPLYRNVLRFLVYYGMHNDPSIYSKCKSLENDDEIVKRLIYCTPDTYKLVPERYQKEMEIVKTCILQSSDSLVDLSRVEHGNQLMTQFFINHPEEFIYILDKSPIRVDAVILDILSVFIEELRKNPSHPTLSKKDYFFYDKKFLKAWFTCNEKACEYANYSRIGWEKNLKSFIIRRSKPISEFKSEVLHDSTDIIDEYNF